MEQHPHTDADDSQEGFRRKGNWMEDPGESWKGDRIHVISKKFMILHLSKKIPLGMNEPSLSKQAT